MPWTRNLQLVEYFVISRRLLTVWIMPYYCLKLKFFGINGSMYSFKQPYLTGRYQLVIINSKISNQDTYSNWGVNSKGVPKGSILRPLLFLIYINHLLSTFINNSIPILFAEDISVLTTTPRPEDLEKSVIESFKQLLRWFNSTLLSLNLKTSSFHSL
jgi:hypothetical protein